MRLGVAIFIYMVAVGVSAPTLAQDKSPEITFWESVRDSKTPAELEAYLNAYPDGVYAGLARIRLEKLSAGTATEASPPSNAEKSPLQATEEKVAVTLSGFEGGKKSWLGVKVKAVTREIGDVFSADLARGALVVTVESKSPASEAGLHPGDIIVEFNGQDVTDSWDLASKVYAVPPGRRVDVVILRSAQSSDDLVAELQSSAANGNSVAMFGLGILFESGIGERDGADAMHWYRKAAEKGYPDAMNTLGLAYSTGKGVDADPAEAVRWYRKAAEKGLPSAMNNLGSAYGSGRGVAKDYAEAVRWYRKAAEKGDTQAMNGLGVAYARGEGVAEDQTEAVSWYRKAAENGDAVGMLNLGIRYALGKGVAQDPAEAVRWYRKAAEKGDARAMDNLGSRYLTGLGIGQDFQKAADWFEKAVAKGNAEAMYDLGFMYANGFIDPEGRGVQPDPEKAADLLLRSLQMGSKRAKSIGKSQDGWSEPVVVRALQRRLKTAGLYAGAIDGDLGPGTKRAIAAMAERSRSQAGAAKSASGTGHGRKAQACGGRPCLRATGSASDGPVNIQERARAWAKVVGKIPAGATGVVSLGETAISSSIEWLHVEYEGTRGWVPAQFLETDTDNQVVTTPSPSGAEPDDLGLPPLEDLERLQ